MSEPSPGRSRDLFAALARPLRDQILSGELAPGELLPSESELAGAAGTTRYAVRKGLMLLRNEDLIEPVAGTGWAVVDRQSASSGQRRLLPRYRQIAAELREAIEAGRLAPGSVLPSEADLVAQHGVSRFTVRHALAVLEADGLISTRPGRGRYVRGD